MAHRIRLLETEEGSSFPATTLICCFIPRANATSGATGAWVFCGTRITVTALLANLEDGVSLTQFGEIFPGVTIEQSRLVLELSTPRPMETSAQPPYSESVG